MLIEKIKKIQYESEKVLESRLFNSMSAADQVALVLRLVKLGQGIYDHKLLKIYNKLKEAGIVQ
jgi:hypothetical protein